MTDYKKLSEIYRQCLINMNDRNKEVVMNMAKNIDNKAKYIIEQSFKIRELERELYENNIRS